LAPLKPTLNRQPHPRKINGDRNIELLSFNSLTFARLHVLLELAASHFPVLAFAAVHFPVLAVAAAASLFQSLSILEVLGSRALSGV
jgi:hypothetical protein